MGTDLLFHRPELYRRVLDSLPDGVRVKQRWEAVDPSVGGRVWSPGESAGEATPLYARPIVHALLADACGNTLWVHEAPPSEVYKRVAGEAAFDKFGLQGSILHFGEAFAEQGRHLVEAVYLFRGGVPKTDFDPAEDYGVWSDLWSRSCNRCSVVRDATRH